MKTMSEIMGEVQEVVRRPMWHLLFDDSADVIQDALKLEGPLSWNVSVLKGLACDDLRRVIAEASEVANELIADLPDDGRYVYRMFGIREDAGTVEVRGYHVSCITATEVLLTYVTAVALPYWHAGGQKEELNRIIWW